MIGVKAAGHAVFCGFKKNTNLNVAILLDTINEICDECQTCMPVVIML